MVFADSDSTPEPEWLRELLRPLANDAVELVAGATYVAPTGGIANKYFALNWLFDLRSDDRLVQPTTRFKANNVAFRRALAVRYPFPTDARFRGRCRSLAQTLTEDGIAMVRNPLARVGHAYPDRLRVFARRAMCAGHDRVVEDRERNVRHLLLRTFQRLHGRLGHETRRTLRHHREVAASGAEVPDRCYWRLGWHTCCASGSVLRSRSWRHTSFVDDSRCDGDYTARRASDSRPGSHEPRCARSPIPTPFLCRTTRCFHDERS